MSILSYKKTLFTLLTIIFATRTIYRYIVWIKKKKLTPTEINEVIVFSEASQLVQSKYSILRTLVPPSTDRILYYLNQSRQTLDICMYILTNRDIAYLVQKLHYRGVKIRFIVESDTAYVSGSEVKRLDKQDAILLRWMKSNENNIMHHKFCLIDASAEKKDRKIVPFVMTGSLNWTERALFGNWESVVVMSEPIIVQGYREEFEKLWMMFKPRNPFL